MEEDKIRQEIEKADPKGELRQSTIEEIIETIKRERPAPNNEDEKTRRIKEEALLEEMENEKDWRIRAKIAAKIISLNLE